MFTIYTIIAILVVLTTLGLSISAIITSNQNIKAKQGPRGLTGSQGPRGLTGSQGPRGPPGKDGTNGTNGTNGTDGKCPLTCKMNEWNGIDFNDGNKGKEFFIRNPNTNKLYNLFINVNPKQQTTMTINGNLNISKQGGFSSTSKGTFLLNTGTNSLYIPSVRPIAAQLAKGNRPTLTIEFDPPLGGLQSGDIYYNSILYQEA
jgi:hypothetical protein